MKDKNKKIGIYGVITVLILIVVITNFTKKEKKAEEYTTTFNNVTTEIEYKYEPETLDSEFIDELKDCIPYEGLDEKYIDYTFMGTHSDIHENKGSYSYSKVYRTYYWKSNDGNTILAATASEGKITTVSKYFVDIYWKNPNKPDLNAKSKTENKKDKDAIKGDDSYDEGYADIYEDDDYDVDRYQSDEDYANGVDDAMDDDDEEYWDDEDYEEW